MLSLIFKRQLALIPLFTACFWSHALFRCVGQEHSEKVTELSDYVLLSRILEAYDGGIGGNDAYPPEAVTWITVPFGAADHRSQMADLAAKSGPFRMLVIGTIIGLLDKESSDSRDRLLAIVIDSSAAGNPASGARDLESVSIPVLNWMKKQVEAYLASERIQHWRTGVNPPAYNANVLRSILPLCKIVEACGHVRDRLPTTDPKSQWCSEIESVVLSALLDKNGLEACAKSPEIWPFLELAWGSHYRKELSTQHYKSIPANLRMPVDEAEFLFYSGGWKRVSGDGSIASRADPSSDSPAKASTSHKFRLSGITIRLEQASNDARISTFLAQNGAATEVIVEGDTVEITSPIVFNGAKFKIHARRLLFEQNGSIDVSGVDAEPNIDAGINGRGAGSVTICASEIEVLGDLGRPNVIRAVGGKGGNASGSRGGQGGAGGAIEVRCREMRFGDGYRRFEELVECSGGVGGRSDLAPAGDGVSGSIYAYVHPKTPVSWLTPAVAQCELQYLEAIYLSGDQKSTALAKARRLLTLLSEQAGLVGSSERERFAELSSVQNRTATLLRKLEAGLDYFGNPPGWTPELSVTFHQRLFENEVKPAIRTISLLRKVQQEWDRQRQDHAALTDLITQNKNEAKSQLSAAAKLVQADETPPFGILIRLRRDIKDCIESSHALKKDVDQRFNNLLTQARDKAKRPAWLTALNVVGTLCSVVPVPAVAITGGVLGQVTAADDNGSYAEQAKTTAGALTNLYKTIAPAPEAKNAGGAPAAKKGVDAGKVAGQLYTAATELADLAKQTIGQFDQIPEAKAQEELAKLLASDPPYLDLIDRLKVVLEKKASVESQFSGLLRQFSELTTAAADAEIRARHLQAQLDAGQEVEPTLESRMTLAWLQQDAVKRLQLYHYFAAQAFAHRFSVAYPVNFNVVEVYDTIDKALQDKQKVDPEVIAGLVKRSVEAVVTKELVTAVNTVGVESSAAVTVELSEQQNSDLLKLLNKDHELTVNLYETPWEKPFIDDQIIGGRIIDVSLQGHPVARPNRVHANAQVAVYSPPSASVVYRGDVHQFSYDETYYKRVLSMFSIYADRVAHESKWSEQLSDDLFAYLLKDEPEKCRTIANLLKWPGADSNLKITLSKGDELDRLAITFTIRGYTDQIKDRRIRVRAVVDDKSGGFETLDGAGILVTTGDDGGYTPFAIVRDKNLALRFQACPFVGLNEFVGWRVDGQRVATQTAGELELVVSRNHSVEAVYQRWEEEK